MRKTLTLLLFIASGFANAQKHANVSGTWNMNVETSAGNGSPVFILKHITETTLAGTYTGRLGEADVTGTIQENKIHLEFTISGTTIMYDGIVTGETMSGQLKLGSLGEGTFTGKRKKE